MKTYRIEYTTNLEDRRTACLQGTIQTDAYIKFTLAPPKHYIITDMEQINEDEKSQR